MKLIAFLLFLVFVVSCSKVEEPDSKKVEGYQPRIGDVYFQSLPMSPLVAAIEGATHSPYSHCGILNFLEGEWFVYEALGSVKRTRLELWIARGRGYKYDVFRFEDKYVERVDQVLKAAQGFMGRPYDMMFEFDDEKIYCSELIYKSFKNVFDENLGEVKKLKELHWEPFEVVIRSVDPSLPLEREMITPKHLSEAPQLNLVYKSL